MGVGCWGRGRTTESVISDLIRKLSDLIREPDLKPYNLRLLLMLCGFMANAYAIRYPILSIQSP